MLIIQIYTPAKIFVTMKIPLVLMKQTKKKNQQSRHQESCRH